jgi:hypothetical protein
VANYQLAPSCSSLNDGRHSLPDQVPQSSTALRYRAQVPRNYPLEDLEPGEFDRLAVALARAAFGPGIEVYGSGRDGGREATFKGRSTQAHAVEVELFRAENHYVSAEPAFLPSPELESVDGPQ